MKPVNVADYREAARRRLPKVLFDYIDGGAYAEWTLAENVEALKRLTLRQRVLRDVSKLKFRTELFGQELSMPVALAPVGYAGMNARRGEVQAARAAKAAGVPFCLSTVGLCSIGEVAKAVAPPWFQLYMIRDRGLMDELLATAREAGCPALLFTVDLPVPGVRYRDARNTAIATTFAEHARQAMDGLSHPAWLWDVQVNGGPHCMGNLASATQGLNNLGAYWGWVGRNFDPSVTWKDIDWVRERWPGPLVIKGILDAEDAREARAFGADGVVVSNHGGRQLDGAPASITALPAIADAVGGDMKVLMDGGIRSGLDVLKALALGADACLIGRAWVFALGARGEAGVTHVLNLMRQELRLAMSLTGCLDVADAGPELLA
ncbi:MAG: L-lactate dehydrogenase [Caulobacteraceae bacterium]|nr:L-lactate dehydrogenase [Caulobacteraceae bacterium]